MILGWIHRGYSWLQDWRDIPNPVERVDPLTALLMPDVGLPRMRPNARAVFRAILASEKPFSSYLVRDLLILAQARGFSAYPRDWAPAGSGVVHVIPLYESWAEWLARRHYIPYQGGVPLTAENWTRWSKEKREREFGHLLHRDTKTALDLLNSLGMASSPKVRSGLIRKIDFRNCPDGLFSATVDVVHRLLNDPEKQVRDAARSTLAKIDGPKNERGQAKLVARYLVRTDEGGVALAPELFEREAERHLRLTSWSALAAELEMPPASLARAFNIDGFKEEFRLLFFRTADLECREIVARRLVAVGRTDLPKLFSGVDRKLWREGLELTLPSAHSSSILDFLGEEAGSLGPEDLPANPRYQHLGKSIRDDLKRGAKPERVHDPLRHLAMIANKEAAAIVLREAIASGMSDSDPRLLYLKFNLAL